MFISDKYVSTCKQKRLIDTTSGLLLFSPRGHVWMHVCFCPRGHVNIILGKVAVSSRYSIEMCLNDAQTALSVQKHDYIKGKNRLCLKQDNSTLAYLVN